MTRVSALAVLFCAAMTLAVTEVNAQCASCSQSTPVFTQSYTPAPATVSYAAPMTYTAAPVVQGCSGCATTTQTYTAAPVQGCCGNSVVSAPVMSAAPVTVAAPASGCCGQTTSCCPQPSCDPCCGNQRVSLRDRMQARRAARTARKCCNTSCCY